MRRPTTDYPSDAPRPFPRNPGKVAAFLILLAAAVLIADRGMARMLDYARETVRLGRTDRVDFSVKLNHFLSLPERPEWLIIGSSKAARDVMPSEFPRPAFNLGKDGAYLLFDYGLLKILEQEGRLGNSILLQIDPKIFFAGKAGGYFKTDLQQLKFFHGRNPWVTQRFRSLPLSEQVKFVFRTYRFNGEWVELLKNRLRQGPIQPAFDGFEPLPAAPGDSEKTVYQLRTDTTDQDPGGEVDFDAVDLLDSVAQFCRSHSVRLVCFSSPDYRDRASHYLPVRKRLDSLLAKHGVPYLDYNRSRLDSLGDIRHWKDLSHLNVAGAAVFSRHLAKAIGELPDPARD